METRIAKIEKEIAIISVSMTSIAKTLEKMSDINTQSSLQAQSIAHMDKQIGEAFKRVYGVIEEDREARKWLSRSVIGITFAGIAKILFDKITIT